MLRDRTIFLPEAVIQDLTGRALPQAVAMEFDYCGQRYRARQRDPLRSEAEVPCELIEPLIPKKTPRKSGGRGRRLRP